MTKPYETVEHCGNCNFHRWPPDPENPDKNCRNCNGALKVIDLPRAYRKLEMIYACAREVREKQRAYFASRTKAHFQASIQAERVLDKFIEEFETGKAAILPAYPASRLRDPAVFNPYPGTDQ